jgi:[CysO sulfur-carrier protein]-S-L-cysteine hydrolase
VLATFKIKRDALQTIERHVLQWPDAEVCGLLAGKDGVAELALRTLNAAPNPPTEYEIAPAELFAAMRVIREAGFTLVGIYHSHLHGDASPSARDIAEATYPDAAYVIAVASETGEVRARAWSLRSGAASELAIEVTGPPPQAPKPPKAKPPKPPQNTTR